MPTISVRLPNHIVEKIDKMAEKEGIKRSQMIRKILMQALESPTNGTMGILILNKKIKALFSRVGRLEEEVRRMRKGFQKF